MRFVLDTSAYSAFNRGDERLRKWFRSTNEILLPLLVVGELRAGFAAGNRRKENEALLERFLDSPNVNGVTITDATTKEYADIYISLRQAGKPIGSNDMWIAAIAFEQGTSLLTLDNDFHNVVGLKIATI